GIYSYMAFCEELQILTKTFFDLKPRSLTIERKKFNRKRQRDVRFPAPEEINCDFHETGTRIILSGFDKNSWNQIDIKELKKEIEAHFEIILRRENISISVTDYRGKTYKCEPFDYDKFNGDEISDNVDILKYRKRGRGPRKGRMTTMNLKKPINYYVKLLEDVAIDKPPVIFLNGRRIAEVKEIKSFKSKHKRDLWARHNITGFIDAQDLLQPTLARDDFRNTDKTRAFFHFLKELEELLLEDIRKMNREAEERHYQALEVRLNQILSKLARKDRIRRYPYLVPSDTGDESTRPYDTLSTPESMLSDNAHEEAAPGDNTESSEQREQNDNPEKEADKPDNAENIKGDKSTRGEKRFESGFNIQIVDKPLIRDELTGETVKSVLIGDTIEIYRNHPEFEERVKKSLKGEAKITQRLVTYLAGEISIHYKDHYFHKKGIDILDKKILQNFVNFIYKFEEDLQKLSGKNLSDI
ncbi:MAG: hypothetical protein ACLFQE_06050, partial [Thermotogota bacterium]